MPTSPPEIRITRRIAAPPTRVFDAWLDPALMARFLFATPGGVMQPVENAPRVGGHFTVVERRGDGDAPHYGVWRLLERPTRLAFTFSTERHDPQAGLVTVTLNTDGDGCLLTLTHALEPEWAAYTDQTRNGWTSMLDTLADVLDTRAPGMTAEARLVIRRPVAEVFEAFVDPAITTRFWFSRGDARLAPGVRTHWHWDHCGAQADLEVLAFEPPYALRIAWGDAGAMTTMDWTLTPLDDARTCVEIREHGFAGDRDAVVAAALDSTGGFHLVLAGAKAWLEHGIALDLVRDHLPDHLESSDDTR